MTKRVQMQYSAGFVEISVPESATVFQYGNDEFPAIPAHPDPERAAREALTDPIGAPPLRELAGPSDTVGVIFSDITRPTPNHLMLPVLLGEFDHVPDERIVLFNSTGTHRANTEAELRGMLGDEVVDRYRIVQNDAGDRASHVRVGTWSNSPNRTGNIR